MPVYVSVFPLIDHVVDGVDAKEWIAVKMGDIFSELSVLCNAISDFCTSEKCPVMRAGPYYEYAWAETGSTEYAVPTIVSARKYMELLMTWVDSNLTQLSNESQLNTGWFNINLKIFCRRSFRIYAHIFAEHFEETKPIHRHFRYSLLHFLIFMNEFGLLVTSTEIEPIKHVVASLGIPNLTFTN